MAYDANIDYRALQNQLKDQMKGTTDAGELARLQSQWDTYEGQRTQKLASNLSQLGKYATDSEIDAAAGLMAERQIGTGYETQKQNLNKAYDLAKQTASQDALSRGMARSSYVQDRAAGLDSERATSLSNVDAARELALQNAKSSIIDKYQTDMERRTAAEKSEFANTIGAYYADFQAEINRIQNQQDRSEDWKIPYLNAAREQKIKEIEQRELQQAALNAQYGDYSGLGLSDTALQYAEGMFQQKNPYLFTPTYSGGGYSYGGGGYTPAPAPTLNSLIDTSKRTASTPTASSGSLKIPESINQKIGMNQSKQGQASTIERYYKSGQLSEAAAKQLYKTYGIG